MTPIPEEIYRTIVGTMPILCVDCVIVNKKGQYLLVKRQNPTLKSEWWVPGGRVYKGEKLGCAIRRKVKEALGIKLKNVVPLGYYEDEFEENPLNVESGLHSLGIVFQAEPKSLDIKLDGQIDEWKFFDKLPNRLIINPFIQDPSVGLDQSSGEIL